MTEHERIGEKAKAFFEDLWGGGDHWDLQTSEFEQARYARLLATLNGRQYGRVLEIGCGAGSFTRHLAPFAAEVVALDISPTAIARARELQLPMVDFRVANVMEYKPRAEGPWDLVVMTETIYYLGWLYAFFDVGWLASELFAATRNGGQLLLANTQLGAELDHALLLPWLIRTYRDLFVNVGYQLETEEIFQGAKNGVDLEVLISLFVKTRHE